MNYRFFLIAIFLFPAVLFSQTATVLGKVVNYKGEPLEFVNVTIKGTSIGTSTNQYGQYSLNVPANQQLTVVYSSIGFSVRSEFIMLKLGQHKNIDIQLEPVSQALDQVNIEDKQVRKTTLTRLNPKLTTILPDATGSIEAMIKTLPGVSSNNELSSQYSVRGGNFDENLVYVNDVLIYRPFLVRSGQQEGLSFINSDMVSSVLFSAGGFESKYGDKMSSALDIKYRKPTEFGGSVSASLLGANIMLQGDSKNHRFTHISGFRYKTTKYVLNSLETKGDYDPVFFDFQTYLTYNISQKLEISFIGNIALNNYTFIPTTRETKFGTIDESYKLTMYFDGQEVDKFETYTGALSLAYKVTDNLNLKLITSAYSTIESETFTIQSQYFLNQLDTELGSETMGDSIANVGVGTGIESARNYLDAQVFSIEHRGIWSKPNNLFQWGLRAERSYINDNLKEYVLLDSADYSLPLCDTALLVKQSYKARNNINANKFTAFAQNTYSFNFQNVDVDINAGIRAHYWGFNNEIVISPRFSLSVVPKWQSDFLFRFAAGYYYQPPFYKELRLRDGSLNNNIKSQKSVHFVLGSDYNFKAWNRPFKLVTELYYKILDNLITYQVDNVRIIYSGKNDANGYAMGFDMKVNGEFVKGVDSWLSLSIMKTEEDVWNDGHGYIPRPGDQRVNASIFFQDYLPNNPSYKMQLQLNFGTGLPFGPPESPRYFSINNRTTSYQRVDIGFSKVLKSENKFYPKGHILHNVNDAWIALEIFNLMDRENTISHEWVYDYSGRQYAVENSLTGRRLNIKLSVNF